MSVEEQEQLAALALASVAGLGPAYIKRLADLAGSFTEIERVGPEAAAEHSVPQALISRIRSLTRANRDAAQRTLDRARRLGIRVTAYTDPDYPALLKEIADPPPVLFIKGSLEPADRVSVAIVGTRKSSPAGLGLAEEFGRELAASGVTVVSGLALGVDGAAHRGALEADGGRTIAVLGSGVDVIYPRSHEALSERIASGRGAVISEFEPGTPPDRHHFPRRNRIVSGLSLATVVVEAPERSGSLITARLAMEQGREVLAVPYPARSPGGSGSNRLIREGAHLVERLDDVLSVIEMRAGSLRLRRAAQAASEPAHPVLDQLSAPSGLDELRARTGLPTPDLLAELTKLEMDGRIKRMSSTTWQAVAPA